MRTEVRSVSFILGGSGYVSRADWDAGLLSLRAHTKAGKPRNRRVLYRGETPQPLFFSRCLTIDSIGENRAHLEGRAAFASGAKWWNNPHESGSTAAYDWDQGHTFARKAAALTA